jgi:hypothetical protein
MALGIFVGVAHVPGGEVKRIKRTPRSEASGLRRKALHVGRIRGAQTPAERIRAASDYLLAQLAHVDQAAADQASSRIASVVLATAEALESNRIDTRRRVA